MKTIGVLVFSVAVAITTFGQEAPVQLVPDVAATMDNGCRDRSNGIVWDFFWVPVAGARKYHLWVKRDAAAKAWIEAELKESTYLLRLPGIFIGETRPTNWTWRVRAQVGSKWTEWSEERKFEVEPVDADCPRRAGTSQ